MEQQLKAPPEVKRVAEFLRSGSAGLKIRVGALNGKRIDYFKGKSAIKALLSPSYSKLKNVPKVSSEAEATTLLSAVNAFAFFLRVQRGAPTGASASSPKALQLIPEQMFAPKEHYAWFYEGSQWTTYAGGILMVALMLAGVMFPLWPPTMRLGVWYLSIAMLGLIGVFFGIAIVRLVVYVVTVVLASPGIWIFPQLFADVGFVDSFIPLWEWDLPKKKSKKKSSKDKSSSSSSKDKSEKSEKSSSKGKARADPSPSVGGAFIEEVEEESASASDDATASAASGAQAQAERPRKRGAPRVEEVEDEDA